jgi:hypothetical protein
MFAIYSAIFFPGVNISATLLHRQGGLAGAIEGDSRVSRLGAYVATLLATCLLAGTAQAHDDGIVAPTPKGGLEWDVLASSNAVAWHDPTTGVEHLRPQFSPQVVALRDKPVTIAGFMMPLDEDKPTQTHFILFQSPPDCLFHMSLGPTHFVEVTTDKPIETTGRPLVLQGTLQLIDKQQGGVFYRIADGKLVSVL